MSANLRVGDQVIWRGAWGHEAPLTATVTVLEQVLPDEKHGIPIEEMAWKHVSRNAVVTLDNGHWAYGYQLAPAPATSQAVASW